MAVDHPRYGTSTLGIWKSKSSSGGADLTSWKHPETYPSTV
jgi:hypothetical protein